MNRNRSELREMILDDLFNSQTALRLLEKMPEFPGIIHQQTSNFGTLLIIELDRVESLDPVQTWFETDGWTWDNDLAPDDTGLIVTRFKKNHHAVTFMIHTK